MKTIMNKYLQIFEQHEAVEGVIRTRPMSFIAKASRGACIYTGSSVRPVPVST